MYKLKQQPILGSSFTKSKPKQGFMTVAQLATLRCVFLPLYSKWWTQQTSIKIYIIIFLLYVSELINVAIYYTNFSSDLMNGHHNDDNDDDPITSSEVRKLIYILNTIDSKSLKKNTCVE